MHRARGSTGAALGFDARRMLDGGDSAGGNMTAAPSLRLKDQNQQHSLKAQILLYPEAPLPFDTPAAVENNAVPPSHRYVSPGMQPVGDLEGLPPATAFTCGFDPLRDVGVEYARKLKEVGNMVVWRHKLALTHGFFQMAPWSEDTEGKWRGW
ncbi:Alpha/Beta hydrolase protein [Hypoxylon rubiginosum]|uniref:Alpha/Beta hydrolase protein n=1 Tax=Hypoxylon rubiginosum TaxID=110542 RepID=A0ACC0D098_9PEZI|nr:Alpha/Beta hydrolase protein [Hypoxylon rubiginosum]